jgi:cation transporter-like permease
MEIIGGITRKIERIDMRFSLAKLMMLVTILSVTGAALSYLAQTLRAPQDSNLRFVLFCVIAPPVLLVVTSLICLVLTRLRSRRRR